MQNQSKHNITFDTQLKTALKPRTLLPDSAMSMFEVTQRMQGQIQGGGEGIVDWAASHPLFGSFKLEI